MAVPQALTNDDLIWIIGQKEAMLLLVTRQAQALIKENELLKSAITTLKETPSPEEHAPDHG
jgi:hypothetical protein